MPLPEYLSTDWFALEEEVVKDAEGRLHANSGDIRLTLSEIEDDLRRDFAEPHGFNASYDEARLGARRLVNHVEQCWATAILR